MECSGVVEVGDSAGQSGDPVSESVSLFSRREDGDGSTMGAYSKIGDWGMRNPERWKGVFVFTFTTIVMAVFGVFRHG